MKRKGHTPEHKLRDGDRLLNEGKDFVEVLRLLEVTGNRLDVASLETSVLWHEGPDAKCLKALEVRTPA